MIEEITPNEEEDGITTIADEPEIENHYREASKRALQFMYDCAWTISGYTGDTKFAFECWMLAMGFTSLLPENKRTQAGLAKAYKNKKGQDMSKANVNKLVIQFQSFLNFQGDRTAESRSNMKNARKKQIQ